MPQQRLLVVGGGMAGVRLVEEVVKRAPRRFAITIVGGEPRPGYNRVLLSALLARDVSEDDIRLRDEAWYRASGVRLITGDPVTGVDAGRRIATLSSGETIPFDQCVFATGSQPVRLPLPGADLGGVIAFRDLDDVAAMERAAADGKRIAVIGGGLLGIEAAYGLAKLGADVTLVHVMDSLMERQLDRRAAEVLRRAIAAKGVKVLLARKTLRILGDDKVEGLAFEGGEELPADMVVFAVGIRPNADVAKAAGLPIARGIVVDDKLAAGLPGFHAIGECAEHQGAVYGLVEPAYGQAAVLAASLCGEKAAYGGTLLSTNLKVSGVPVFSAGDFMGGEGAEEIIADDGRHGLYKKLVIRDGRLAGVVLVGDADDALWYLALIREGREIGALRRNLIFGPGFAEPGRRAA
jgi:nitrite reductase (NADH) large subunit